MFLKYIHECFSFMYIGKNFYSHSSYDYDTHGFFKGKKAFYIFQIKLSDKKYEEKEKRNDLEVCSVTTIDNFERKLDG